MDRRSFLLQATATVTVATLWAEGLFDLGRARRVVPTPPGAPRQSLDEAAWSALEAATHRLLPSSEDSPGAKEVNAVGYLDAALAEPDVDPEIVVRIREGAARLDTDARTRGAERFAALPTTDQDAVLHGFEKDWPSQLWLRALITFVMEAFLGDPRHGGNPDEIGWRWAGHTPGSPRPPADWSPAGEGPR